MDNNLNRRFYAIANKIAVSKELICIAASGGRTGKYSDLTEKEVIDFCNYGHRKMVDKQEDMRDRNRKQLMAMAYSIDKKPKDMIAWCEKMGVGSGDKRVKRKFNEYTLAELIKLKMKYKKVVDFTKKKKH